MFIIAYALQLNIYLGKIQDPLILPNHTGMLVDIFQDVIDSFKTRRNEQVDLLYVDQPDQANITFNFIRNYNQEKSIVLTQDAIQLDYSQYDLSKPILTENYIFIYPSLVVTLFSRIVWELFFNYIIIIFPWIMIYANFMIFFLSKQKYKTYSKKIRVSLQILVGNQETNQYHYTQSNRSTLILKIMFIIITFLISAIIFIDFIYVVGNAIQRQNFNSLNDLAMNQFQLCSVKNDRFVSDMIQRYRDISYQEKDNIQQCIDVLHSIKYTRRSLKMKMLSSLQASSNMDSFSRTTQNTPTQSTSQSTTLIEAINCYLIQLLISIYGKTSMHPSINCGLRNMIWMSGINIWSSQSMLNLQSFPQSLRIRPFQLRAS